MNIRNLIVAGIIMTVSSATLSADEPVAYVNPFIGTTNFGTTNPGAICPNGLMSVTPFNVMGSDKNVYDKDARWWSTPYEYHNTFFTGFSHVNLSGVGCPELGSLLLMPTSGELNVDYKQYGSEYALEEAHPGYYANRLTRYGIDTEVSATPRTSIARFTYPGGESHILLNLGEGLTNESGATIRKVSDTEYEGSKLLGGFCYYNRQGVFPIYFVIRVNKKPLQSGYWKKQRPMTGVEAEWDPDNGKYKIYTRYTKEMSGDDIGVFFSYDTKPGEQIQVQMGVSFVSIENARQNLDSEQQGFQFDKVCLDARNQWNDILSRIEVEGGSDEQKNHLLYGTIPHVYSPQHSPRCQWAISRYGERQDTHHPARSLHRLLAMGYIPQRTPILYPRLSPKATRHGTDPHRHVQRMGLVTSLGTLWKRNAHHVGRSGYHYVGGHMVART